MIADMHSHFLLNAHYLSRPFARTRPDLLPFGPFGNRLDLDGCAAGGVGCLTFTAYVPPSPFFFVPRSDALLGQIRAFHRILREGDGKVVQARSGSEVRAAAKDGRLAAVLAVEGGHAIDGDLRVLGALASVGTRMLTLTHFVANDLADSSTSPYRPHGGLSPLGRLAVREMERLGIIVDVAHMTDAGVRQVLAAATRPVVCSHTGMRALHDIPRNLPDDLAREVARSGGVIGVIMFPCFLGPGWRAPLSRFLDHVVHAASVAGADHVGIGSDMDGWNWTPAGFHGPRDFAAVVDGLSQRGLSDAEVRGIAGENYLRLLG